MPAFHSLAENTLGNRPAAAPTGRPGSAVEWQRMRSAVATQCNPVRVLFAAREPVAAEDLEAMIVDVPLPIAGVGFAGEGPVQEASDFAFAGEEIGKLIDQEVVIVAQGSAFSLTRTAGGKRVIQVEDVIGGGRTGHQSRRARE
jgi:hypothetical protein